MTGADSPLMAASLTERCFDHFARRGIMSPASTSTTSPI